MAWSPIAGTAFQFSNLTNELAVDYYLKMYDAGTTDPYSMATDAGGLTRLAKCKISAEGYPVSNPADDSTVFVPHVDQNYRIVLYRNETDADNDTTANAAWNVDDLLPDSTIAADISQITTRGTTLQAQDDYDRSPLLVDGTDFTAGLGPHVLTMPVQVPAWTPNDADFRFYKLSTAGAITTPIVTSSDATTFTVSDTLLSTDTLFVGDDEFRNQMDGDSTDIKTRLGLSDALLASNNLSDVGNAATARTNLDVYSEAEADSAFIEDSEYIVTRSQALGGDFNGSDEIDIVKFKDLVTITVSSGSLSFSATAAANSTANLLAAAYRPAATTTVSTFTDAAATNGVIQTVRVLTTGTIQVLFRPRDGASFATQTAAEPFTITYIAG